jgi:hypothetical protein
MRLAFPKEKVKLTKINGQTPETQVLKALSKVSLEGEVVNIETGLLKNNFNGKILVSVFDKPSELSTLGQKTNKFRYKTYRNQVFEGQISVINGLFKVTFIVPKDINYQLGQGRVNFYAISSDSTLDATGSYNQLMIGGSEDIINSDTEAPKVELSVDTNNLLTAKISDASGINVSQAGIGHEMILTLNDTMQITVNQYFTSDEDYTKGVIKYPFGQLPAGSYTVKLKVWDTYNNSTEVSLSFIVENQHLMITRAFNYPNPFTDLTSLYIEHNAENQDLNFQLSVFDVFGKLIFEKEESCFICDKSIILGMKIEPKNWTNGTYFYKIILRSSTENANTSSTGKMVFWK